MKFADNVVSNHYSLYRCNYRSGVNYANRQDFVGRRVNSTGLFNVCIVCSALRVVVGLHPRFLCARGVNVRSAAPSFIASKFDRRNVSRANGRKASRRRATAGLNAAFRRLLAPRGYRVRLVYLGDVVAFSITDRLRPCIFRRSCLIVRVKGVERVLSSCQLEDGRHDAGRLRNFIFYSLQGGFSNRAVATFGSG